MIQPFSYIISKRVNDLKKCISNEPGMGLGKGKKGITINDPGERCIFLKFQLLNLSCQFIRNLFNGTLMTLILRKIADIRMNNQSLVQGYGA